MTCRICDPAQVHNNAERIVVPGAGGEVQVFHVMQGRIPTELLAALTLVRIEPCVSITQLYVFSFFLFLNIFAEERTAF